MGKYIILISLLLASCASRKVSISKTQVEYSVDSTYSEKKDSTYIEQRAVFINETTDEIEISPIDTSKPIQINNVRYFNAKVKIKKINKEIIDTTKVLSSNVSTNNVVYNRTFKEVKSEKKSDKKANYYIYLWLLLIPAIWWIGKKVILKW